MALSTTINYDTASNFVYNSSEVEFTGGLARSKDNQPSAATLGARLDTDANALYSAGSATGTLVNSAAISGGKLDLQGGTNRGLRYSATGNMATTNVGCIRFKYTPGYTGPSPNTAFFLNIGTGGANAIQMAHNTSGTISVLLWDNAGVLKVNSVLSNWAAVDGDEYVFELNWDGSGATRLFIDGTQHGSTITTTFDRTGAVPGNINIGFSDTATAGIDGLFRDFQIFNEVQNTANHTASTARVGIYADETDIITGSGVSVDGVSSFSAVTTTPSGSSVKFVLNVSGQDKYWNSSAWVNSNGTAAQANTAAEINSNVGDLDLSAGATLKVRAILVSDTGAEQPSITSVTYTYDFYAATPLDPTTCTIYGFVRKPSNISPSASVTGVIFEMTETFFNGGLLVQPYTVTATTDSRGYFEQSLIETATASKKYTVKLQYINAQGRTLTTTLGAITVPAESFKEFSTFTFS